jgi:hypothetical protein
MTLRLANPLRPACHIPPKAAHAYASRLRWFAFDSKTEFQRLGDSRIFLLPQPFLSPLKQALSLASRQ